MYFAHEKLDCYRVALCVARAVGALSIPASRKHLRDQVIRAADSMVLNVAEGLAREGDARRNHLRIALGSAAEVSAVFDLLDVREAATREALHRVGAMLASLSRR